MQAAHAITLCRRGVHELAARPIQRVPSAQVRSLVNSCEDSTLLYDFAVAGPPPPSPLPHQSSRSACFLIWIFHCLQFPSTSFKPATAKGGVKVSAECINYLYEYIRHRLIPCTFPPLPLAVCSFLFGFALEGPQACGGPGSKLHSLDSPAMQAMGTAEVNRALAASLRLHQPPAPAPGTAADKGPSSGTPGEAATRCAPGLSQSGKGAREVAMGWANAPVFAAPAFHWPNLCLVSPST